MHGHWAGHHFPTDRHAVERPRDARTAHGWARLPSQQGHRGNRYEPNLGIPRKCRPLKERSEECVAALLGGQACGGQARGAPSNHVRRLRPSHLPRVLRSRLTLDYYPRMKCPHCLTAFHDAPTLVAIGKDKDDGWMLKRRMCPACGRLVLSLVNGPGVIDHSAKQLIGLSSVWKE